MKRFFIYVELMNFDFTTLEKDNFKLPIKVNLFLKFHVDKQNTIKRISVNKILTNKLIQFYFISIKIKIV